MIKRRFYRYEHGDKDAPSESSSSSDSEVEAESTDETEIEEDEENEVAEVGVKEDASSSSGYESEDSSANEVNLDSSGLPTSDEDVAAQNGGQNLTESLLSGEGDSTVARMKHNAENDKIQFDKIDCVLRCKSVFKCRLCPRIVCLSEETMKAHLNSKRHARSEKLQREGRLKLMLNDEGQLEGESHIEKHATTTSSGQEMVKSKKKNGRLKPRKRARQETNTGKGRRSTNQEKRRKNDR